VVACTKPESGHHLIERAVRTIVVLQPGYLPWLGYFEQLYQSDVFVVLDDVQYDKNGWRNRNRVRTADGWCWLTVPVVRDGLSELLIKDVRVDETRRWRSNHWKTLRQHYRKAPHFDQYEQALEGLYRKNWDYLLDLDLAFADCLARAFGISRPIRLASEFRARGKKTERLIELCAAAGASHYYSGAAAREYLDVGAMEHAGVTVTFQDYDHPHYPQVYGPFIPYLSAVDLLLNAGPESLAVILSGARNVNNALLGTITKSSPRPITPELDPVRE
jgi:hypothetical protein